MLKDQNNLKYAALIAIVLLLNACGFHLRGDSKVMAKFNPLFIEQGQLSADQLKRVRDSLKQAEAELATSAITANKLTLKLTPLKTRTLADSTSSGVELIQLAMRIDFSVIQANGTILIEQSLEQTQEVQLDTNNVLSQDNVLKTNREALEKNLLRSMIFQLSNR